MVGGSKVLLSIAVLSGLGFGNVNFLGAGRLRRQDGTARSVQSAPGSASSSTSSQPEMVASLPQSTATVTTVAAPLGEQTGTGSAGGEATSLDSSSQAATASYSTSSLTSQADIGISTSAGEESISSGPGSSRADWTLTTDTRAPTQTAASTQTTQTLVLSSSGAERQPAPADTGASTTSTPTPSKRPTPGDSGYNYGPATTGAETPTVVAAPAPVRTPPRGGPPNNKPTSVSFIKVGSDSVDLGYGTTSTPALPSNGTGSSRTTFVTSTLYANQTFTLSPSGGVSYCQPSDLTVAPTSWSVVHTTTITWYGDPADYTQPYPPISIPTPTSSCIVPSTPPVWTISVCASTGTDSKYRTCDVRTTSDASYSYSYGFGIQTSTVPGVTFITTDKNPAVVFTTINTPDYGVSQEAKTRDNHVSPTAPGGISTPVYNSQNPAQGISGSAQRPTPTPTPITVAVQPTAVVINGNTIRDNPAQQTQIVIIADQTFTIDPTKVVGAGTSIDRPSATGGVYLPIPTSTNLGGVPVIVSSSVAVIGDASFTLGPTPITATVSGQTFTVGASTIAGGPSSQTLLLPTLLSPTEVVVAGGDLITAIGGSVVVVHGTTLTYALSSIPTTTTLDYGNGDDGDDVVLTIGPGGVTIGTGTATTVIGGTHASSPAETQYALVGGATITKIGASVVVVQGTSYTLGPAPPTTGMLTTTAVHTVGGETVTVAPTGVEVGTLTMRYPFGPTTVITPTPGAGAGGASALATSTGAAGGGGGRNGQEEEEDVAGVVRPWLVGVIWAVGVAVGVGLMV